MFSRGGTVLRSRVARMLSINSIFTWSSNEVGAYTRNTPHEPHSEKYIQHQLYLFNKKSIPAKVIQLFKGTLLTGPISSNDIVLGSQAVYPGSELNLSLREILNIQETSPSLSKFTLKEDVQCIESLGDNQQTVYYVHYSKLKLGELIPVSELSATGPSI